MADEIQVVADAGDTLYFHIRTTIGKVWYPVGSTFEAYGNGARDSDDYDITLSDLQVGLYTGDFDANISDADSYVIVVLKQLGANPADADLVMGSEAVVWDGGGGIIDALDEQRAHAFFVNKASQNKDTGDITVYAEDDVTVLDTYSYSDSSTELVRTRT